MKRRSRYDKSFTKACLIFQMMPCASRKVVLNIGPSWPDVWSRNGRRQVQKIETGLGYRKKA